MKKKSTLMPLNNEKIVHYQNLFKSKSIIKNQLQNNIQFICNLTTNQRELFL
jgi:hypothetical protein